MNQQPMPQMQNPRPVISKWLLVLLIIVVVLAAGFFSWYFLMGPGKKTTTTTTPTTTPTTTAADWKVVKNTKYGYQITLTDVWKGYRWEEVPGPSGMTGTISYYVPTTDATVAENATFSGKYAKILNIEVFTPAQWSAADQTKNKYINKNDTYNFAYTAETVTATDLKTVDFGIPAVITSFKFITASADTVCTNATYGFSYVRPTSWGACKTKDVPVTGSTMTYYVEIATKDANFATGDEVQDAGYYSPFAISVFTLDQWTAAQAEANPTDTLIIKNGTYAYAWSQANGVPASDFGTKSNDIKTIIASFKLQ